MTAPKDPQEKRQRKNKSAAAVNGEAKPAALPATPDGTDRAGDGEAGRRPPMSSPEGGQAMTGNAGMSGNDRARRLRETVQTLARGERPDLEHLHPVDIETLLHELAVYQAEMETQNKELRQARLKLETARDRYRDLYDFAPVGYFTLDREGGILEANLTACDLLGRPRPSLLGQNLIRWVGNESAGSLLLYLDRTFAGRGRESLEIALLSAGGEMKQVLLDGGRGVDAEGRSVCRLVMTDVTDRRRAEEARRASEARFRTFAEASPLGMFECDAAGRFTWVNARWEELSCLPNGRSLDYRWNLAIHPEDRAWVLKNWPGSQSTVPWREECRLLRMDGSAIWVRLLVSPIEVRDGRTTSFIGTAEDITEGKQKEQALRESEERYRTLFDSIDEGYCVIEMRIEPDQPLDYRFLEINQAFEKQSTLVDAQGKWMRELRPEHEEHWFEIYRDVALTGEPVRFEHCARALGNRWFTVYAFRVGRPEQRRVAVLFSNIIEQKRTEESLREAKATAEDANRAKSEFLANMSHEIRTPMTVILGALEQLREAPEDLREELERMAETSAGRLLALIEDILDFSRIEARRLEVQHEPFELRSAVEAAVSLFRRQAGEKGVELRSGVDPEVPELVLGDHDRLAQVLINLVGNAVKFTERGEVAVAVGMRGGALEFAVRDTGIGIPDDKLEMIFDHFSQVDASRTRRFGGTGLGLAVSRGLVELMGGTLRAESVEGQGSVFFFTLPLAVPLHPPLTSAFPAAEAASTGSGGARILLAEDEPMVSELIEMILRKRGWDVERVPCGGEALARWEAADFDLILMDVQMPTMDGLEATREIRAREARNGGRNVPIIALTAHARSEDREEALAAGMDGWLPKPVSMERLYAAVEEQLQKR